jgi:hypothetical protein
MKNMARAKRKERDFHAADPMIQHVGHRLELKQMGLDSSPDDERVIELVCETCGDAIAWEE